jgi:small subunit ribosomal protein S15
MLTQRVKANVIKEARVHDTDTGSAEVQIGILNRRISELADHLKKNSKDVHSRRGLLKMVSKRRKLEKYIDTQAAKKASKKAKAA